MLVKRFGLVTVLALWLFLFSLSTADAYLDPGTGSYTCQIMLAGLMGTLFIVKLYWNKIKSFFLGFGSNETKCKDE